MYTMAELSTLESTDAFAMAMASAKTVHFSIGLAIRRKNEHPFPKFYGARGEPPNSIAVSSELESIPEGDMNKLFRRYNEVFGLQPAERLHEVKRKEGALIEVHSVRHGHEYEFRELNSNRSGDAMAMATGVGNPTHFRMAFALTKINGSEVSYLTRPAIVRDVLKRIPLSDMELINAHYDEEFASGDDEDDLGNEFLPESRAPDS
jgi:hypothetical protein